MSNMKQFKEFYHANIGFNNQQGMVIPVPVEEDKFDDSKEKIVDQLFVAHKGMGARIKLLQKLDKQGEGSGELKKSLDDTLLQLWHLDAAFKKIQDNLS